MKYLEELNLPPAINQLIVVLLVIVLVWLLVKFLKSRATKQIKDSGKAYHLKKFIDVSGFALVVLALLFIYIKQLGSFTVALGVAGAGIAFALQEVIVSIAGWIALMTGNFYKTGDRVQLGGIKGDVIDIGVLRTTLMETGDWVDGDLYNGRIVRIANSFVFKEPVFNYSGDFPFLWDEIKIPIQYGSNYALARKILNEIADAHLGEYTKRANEVWQKMVKKYLIENAQTAPMITMVTTDNWVEYTLRYVVNFKKGDLQKINYLKIYWHGLKQRRVRLSMHLLP